MNTEILVVKKVGDDLYENHVHNFKGSKADVLELARAKHYGGGAEYWEDEKEFKGKEKYIKLK